MTRNMYWIGRKYGIVVKNTSKDEGGVGNLPDTVQGKPEGDISAYEGDISAKN